MIYFYGLIFLTLYIFVFFDIAKSDFINGRKDKVFFIFLTLFLSPIFYGIFSYGHKIKQTKKEKETFKYIENFSISILFLGLYSISLLAISLPNEFGIWFLYFSGYLILGVVSFHILYPNHWELIEMKTNNNEEYVDNWVKLFPILLLILATILIYYRGANLANIFVADLYLLGAFLVIKNNSKNAFIFLTIFSGPIFWIINFLYLRRNTLIEKKNNSNSYFLVQ